MASQGSLLRFPRTQAEKLLHSLKAQSPITTTLTAVGTSLALFGAWVLYDYRAWKAFGTGGTPPTPSGYIRMTKIRLNRLFSKDNMRDASSLSTEGPSYLNIILPDRTKTRPRVQSRTMPQRQLPEKLNEAVKQRVHALPKKYCVDYPEFLRLDLSHTEGESTDAIYAQDDVPNRHASATDRILKSEIAHVHPAENSLHVWLSEPDARKVVKAGWGERFPLSAMGMVHVGWTFIYAPRSMSDVDIIEEIVKAGISYVTGERL